MSVVQDPTLWPLLTSWSWQPLILVGLGTIAISYAYAFYYFQRHGWLPRLAQRGLVRRRHPWLFTAGLAALSIALLSPVDALADLLLLMHMVQHILLLMVAPPLILLGLPMPLIRWLILETRLRGVLEWLTNPLLTYALFNLNLFLWHVPALYETALRNEFVHELEHALFFYTALLFWWRVLDPTRGWFPLWDWQPARWFYLIVAAPPSYILGSVLWASDRIFYPYYTQVPRLWGISALADQQVAGLLMWVQGWMLIMASMIVFFSWYNPDVEQV